VVRGLGERPFFETIEMRPAEPITGRVETPEGEPAAGVELLAYSRTDKLPRGQFEYGSFAKAKTDAEGKFRLPITTPGRGVYWVLPKAYAPELHLIADGKRGDLGTITLKKGMTVTGWAFDAQGKFSLRVPHGLEQVELDISTNEHASAKHRIGKDGPLTDGRRVKLGTLDHDVKGIEIVRYVAPFIVVNATTKGGQQVKGFKATVEYIEPGPNSDKKVHVVGGGKTEV
jgi:hypothetical protein